MHLEVHPLFIRRHGGEPLLLLRNLSEIGYKSFHGKSWTSLFRQADKESNFHLDLVAKA
jgi:hypothetical protein